LYVVRHYPRKGVLLLVQQTSAMKCCGRAYSRTETGNKTAEQRPCSYYVAIQAAKTVDCIRNEYRNARSMLSKQRIIN